MKTRILDGKFSAAVVAFVSIFAACGAPGDAVTTTTSQPDMTAAPSPDLTAAPTCSDGV